MKTSMKTLAMLTLSACVITGSAVSSFAARVFMEVFIM